MDSAAITVDIKTDTIFQVFELPSFNNIGGFITRGNGPNEEIFVDTYIQHIKENVFLYRSISSIKIINYDTQTRKFEILNQINLTAELMDFWHLFKLGDVIIGCRTEENSEKEFISFNLKTKEISDFGANFPIVENKIADVNKNRLFAKANTVKPDGKLFASVYDKFPILRIYTNTGELKKEIHYENKQNFPVALVEKKPSMEDIGMIMQNYRMIKSSDNYIYALYIGKLEKDIGRGLNDFSNEIHVWDWDGNPIVKILLDAKIFTFDVDQTDEYLICSSLESLDVLYKYNFSQIKDL